MNMSEIVIAVVSLCVISAIIGIALSIAEKVFHVEVNELEVAVREVLPGSNCGGCGYAGCDALAKAIAEGSTPVTACPVGGKPVAEEIAKIMGQEVGDMEKMVAYVRCNGTSDMKQVDYQYIGIESCAYAAKMPGSSPYACKYGCIGCGLCAKNCPSDAIVMENNIARIDYSKCTHCGACAEKCPRKIIKVFE